MTATPIYKLARDVSVMFNGGGNASEGYEVKASAGTALEVVMGGMGPSYAIPVASCQVDPSVGAIFKHDSTYHYVWAPLDAVETIEPEPARDDLANARNQAAAQFASIAELVAAHNAADESGDDEAADDAREAIEQDCLSVQVRSGWHSPGPDTEGPEEYELLLCTGGPAVRIVGDLDRFEPSTARIEYQDWFQPWTELRGVDLPDDEEETLLAYARVFWFGE